MRFILFFIVVSTVVGGAHYYLWVSLVKRPGVEAPWRHALTGLIVALAVAFPIAVSQSFRSGGAPGSNAWAWFAWTWMGLLFITLMLLGSVDFGRWLRRLAGRFAASEQAPADPARRQALARALSGGAAVGSVLLGGRALASGLELPKVVEVEVPLRRLPTSMDGTTIVQLSDVHVGPTIGLEFVEAIVARVNALKPDLVVITGDLVDGSVAELRQAVAPLGRFQTRYGTFFVTGNHELYSGAASWRAHLQSLGIQVLSNRHVTIGQGREAFELCGVEDWSAGRWRGGLAPDLDAALAGCDPARETVLLAHQPKAIFGAAQRKVGLQLSGHTHGGQIWPFSFLVRLVQPYTAGLARHDDTWIYVSRGTGYWGPPMRLNAPQEITRVTLRSGG